MKRTLLYPDEEAALLVEGLEAVQRKHRDKARPRPDRSNEYSHEAARAFHLAGELIARIGAGR